MTRVFCDRCGKELDPERKDQVNVDFNYFGVSGFRARIQGRPNFQFCPDCAVEIHGDLMGRRKDAEAKDTGKGVPDMKFNGVEPGGKIT